MTALTYILGAPPLKVLRRRIGRGNYWVMTLGIFFGFFFLRVHSSDANGVVDFKALALAFLSLAVLIGVFEEFEEMGFGLVQSAFFTLVMNTLLCAGAFAFWVHAAGPGWDQALLTGVEAMLKPVADLYPNVQFNYLDLIKQLPSLAIVLWIASIYVAVLLEGRLSSGDMAPRQAVPVPPVLLREQLFTLRLPDFCVWIFIASLLGAFGDFAGKWIEALSVNALNICLALFFLQGLAVVARFFARMRMGVVWQAVFMFLIVVQLFLFVSLLGLLDFWVNFRERMAKRAGQVNRET